MLEDNCNGEQLGANNFPGTAEKDVIDNDAVQNPHEFKLNIDL